MKKVSTLVKIRCTKEKERLEVKWWDRHVDTAVREEVEGIKKVGKVLKRGSHDHSSFKHSHNSSSFRVLRIGSRGSCGSGPKPKMGPD